MNSGFLPNIANISITITEIVDNLSLDFLSNLQNLTVLVIDVLSRLFPILLCIAIVSANLSLIVGAILYLLESNEEDGKVMIQRSFVTSCLLFFIFNPYSPSSIPIAEPFEGFQLFTSFVISYLLFLFAALSLIIFIGNLGFFLLSSDKKTIRRLKKSFICLICVILPLGFQFPNMPLLKL